MLVGSLFAHPAAASLARGCQEKLSPAVWGMAGHGWTIDGNEQRCWATSTSSMSIGCFRRRGACKFASANLRLSGNADQSAAAAASAGDFFYQKVRSSGRSEADRRLTEIHAYAVVTAADRVRPHSNAVKAPRAVRKARTKHLCWAASRPDAATGSVLGRFFGATQVEVAIETAIAAAVGHVAVFAAPIVVVTNRASARASEPPPLRLPVLAPPRAPVACSPDRRRRAAPAEPRR